MHSSNFITILRVTDEYDGQRIDNYLIRTLKGVPKSLIYRLLRQKKIKLNSKRVKPDHRLKARDELRLPTTLRLADKAPQGRMTQYYPKLCHAIVTETEDYIVLNKPAGLACHGGSGISASVIDIMRSHHPALQLAHRLDRETSGCLMLPKHRQALLVLNQQIAAREIDKYYLCVVQGVWPKRLQKITLPLRKLALANGDRRVIVDEEAGKSATTLVQRIACNRTHSLLAIKLITGRTHQIRVHCAASGHPILGDEKYSKNNQAKRLYLHAVQLVLKESSQCFTAELDETFKAFCEEQQFEVDLNATCYF